MSRGGPKLKIKGSKWLQGSTCSAWRCCCCLRVLRWRGITYVILWFDTEDYVDPITDDAALRIANDLTTLGVHGTFKVVGEKARVLQQRGRIDVIQALGRDCIAF
jgi:hypothetical protein